MVQMLAISMGVAAAGAVLAAFSGWIGTGEVQQTLHAFQATFVCMGLITIASSAIFWQLSPMVRAASPGSEVDVAGHNN
jgi:hypothetical protein